MRSMLLAVLLVSGVAMADGPSDEELAELNAAPDAGRSNKVRCPHRDIGTYIDGEGYVIPYCRISRLTRKAEAITFRWVERVDQINDEENVKYLIKQYPGTVRGPRPLSIAWSETITLNCVSGLARVDDWGNWMTWISPNEDGDRGFIELAFKSSVPWLFSDETRYHLRVPVLESIYLEHCSGR